MLQDRIKHLGLQQSALAASCEVTDGTMSKWLTGKILIPAERVARFCKVTGLEPHEVRPDVFPAPALSGPIVSALAALPLPPEVPAADLGEYGRHAPPDRMACLKCWSFIIGGSGLGWATIVGAAKAAGL